MIEVQPTDRGVLLPVHAQPGARRDALRGEHGGALRVSVTAAPQQGKANEAVRKLLCRTLDLRQDDVQLVAGAGGPRKKFVIRGLTAQELLARIERALADA